MTWTDFYLVCFLVGLALTLVSALGDSSHVHVPHLHLHHGGTPHLHASHGGPGRVGEVSVVNFGTVTAFLAWFGGAGYLMTRYYGLWLWLSLGVAIGTGIGGAAIVFWFIKVLVSHDENLDPADYEMVGVLGRVSSPIRPGGTGELIFSQQGTRRTSGARSEDGAAIAKGTDVIVTRYDRGIAYVRRWDAATGIEEEVRERIGR